MAEAEGIAWEHVNASKEEIDELKRLFPNIRCLSVPLHLNSDLDRSNEELFCTRAVQHIMSSFDIIELEVEEECDCFHVGNEQEQQIDVRKDQLHQALLAYLEHAQTLERLYLDHHIR